MPSMKSYWSAVSAAESTPLALSACRLAGRVSIPVLTYSRARRGQTAAFQVETELVGVTLIVLAVGGSMLVPYLRAKAEAEGLDGRGGMMGRAERVLPR